MSGLTTHVLREFPAPELEGGWRALLARVPMPSHYTSPEWFREPYFDGKRAFAVLVADGDEVLAAATGFHEGALLNCGLPTRPQVQVLEDHRAQSAMDALAHALLAEGSNSELVNFYTWDTAQLAPFASLRFRRSEGQQIPVLDLTLGADTLLKQCDGKRRNAIRTSMKNGLEVGPPANDAEFLAFYNIYRDWCAAKGVFCHALEVEQRAWHDTAANRLWLLARKDGVVIAGSVFRFYPAGLFEYSRNSSLPEFQRLKPNDLLAWRGVEWGISNGCRALSMGGSHRFLREFGGTPTTVYRWRLDRTLGRRHDVRDAVTGVGRRLVSRLPESWEQRVRRLLGKEIPQGW